VSGFLAGLDPDPGEAYAALLDLARPGSSGFARLAGGGNRQLNCALHRIAVSQGQVHPPARDFLAKKQAEGKSRMEALRCLKRHLARRVWRLCSNPKRERSIHPVDSQRDSPTPQIAAAA
jgi:hypothetical protein